jgi:threonine synthase
MEYISTRGGVTGISFSEAVMMGLAEDGGLLLPRAIPRVDHDTVERWRGFSYQELAFEVMSRFIDDIPAPDLKALITDSYASFNDPAVAPMVHAGELHILELFHGPTLAFKDIALQFLGNLFAYLLTKSGDQLNIIGATSGDTGSAAIHGVRGRERINIFILHPHGRISTVQEKQMTTVTDFNVFNIGIQGTFDEAQAIVKTIFSDTDFKHHYRLGAINSINWARVLAQIVYYIYAYLHIRTHEQDRAAGFAVPTGNFGDIFAGYLARKLLPEGAVGSLILATNENDILARLIENGHYSRRPVVATSSPSMDIQAASNFERYLYYLFDKEPQRVAGAMADFTQTGVLDLRDQLDHIRRDFIGCAVSSDEVSQTIAHYYRTYGYVLDPHTAIGVRAGQQASGKGTPLVCLATAHPAKFFDTVEAAIDTRFELPSSLAAMLDMPSRCEVMEAKMEDVKAFVAKHALSSS